MIKDIKAPLVLVEYSTVAVEKRVTLQLIASRVCVFLRILIYISFYQICWYYFYPNRSFIVSYLVILLLTCELFLDILGIMLLLILAAR